jgi:hypothetical protein
MKYRCASIQTPQKVVSVDMLNFSAGGVHHGGGGVQHMCQNGAARRSNRVVIPDGRALMR